MSWYDRDLQGKGRLVLEHKAMQEAAPDFVLKRRPDGALFWEGIVVPARTRFRLEILYPDSFPSEPPWVSVKSPRLPKNTPHLLANQYLCIFHPGYAKKAGFYNPGTTTAATIRGHAINWLLAFEIWRVKSFWPIGNSPIS